MAEFILVNTKEEYHAAALLFREYADWLGIDLSFQHFEEELTALEQMYALPDGGILLCKNGAEFIGCVGIRRIDENNAELKRMYLKQSHQKKGLGSLMLSEAEKLARDLGYWNIRLDTLNTMLPAMKLYERHGYKITEPYYFNPNETAVYFEKSLR
ncbi:MAG: N-acetyltransferase [Ferruginibacter sp.]|nr:N-acetyltransferase [Ferruginibacter sp.]